MMIELDFERISRTVKNSTAKPRNFRSGEETPRSAHESFDAGPGTRLECRQRVFKNRKRTLFKFTFGEKIHSCPADSNLLPSGK